MDVTSGGSSKRWVLGWVGGAIFLPQQAELSQGLLLGPAQAAFKVERVGSVSPSSGESQEVRRSVAVTDGIYKLVWKHPFQVHPETGLREQLWPVFRTVIC